MRCEIEGEAPRHHTPMMAQRSLEGGQVAGAWGYTRSYTGQVGPLRCAGAREAIRKLANVDPHGAVIAVHAAG